MRHVQRQIVEDMPRFKEGDRVKLVDWDSLLCCMREQGVIDALLRRFSRENIDVRMKNWRN